MGQGPKPAKGKAKPAVARKSPKNDGARGRDLEKRLAEAHEQLRTRDRELATALDQQTATSEILRVISSSPTQLQPVLDAVAERAARLCSADDVNIHLVEGKILRLAAKRGPIPTAETRPITRTRHIGRVVLERRTIHVDDIQAALDEFPDAGMPREVRTALATPLLREGIAIGVIHIRRLECRPFSENQIALLKTFADQAVIAIENVRLFKELEARNRDLTATSEILQVISRSPTDVQPVFDTIAATALRLCNAKLCTVFRFDGKLIHLVALHLVSTEGAAAYRDAYPAPPGRAGGTHRAILTGSVVHIRDIREDSEYELQALARANDFGCVLSVPMLRQGLPIGAITVGREAGRAFPDGQIQLLKTFADQAVIAVENVRLFTELQASNHELTTALDTQTATSDILRVISRSQTDLQPVFDAITQSAVRLLRGYTGVLTRLAGNVIELAAVATSDDTGDVALRATMPRFPQSLDTPIHGRAIRERSAFNFADAQTDQRLPEFHRTYARERGYQSQVVVPMLRHGGAVGTISLTRRESGGFTDDEIALLQTFADQAVIAIENVRLFNETKEALEQQTATADILRVISNSPTDAVPVFDAIVRSAHQLLGGHAAALLHLVGDDVHLGAYTATRSEGDTALTSRYPLSINELASQNPSLARVLLDGEIDHVPDSEDPSIGEFARSLARARGHRSRLMVPLRRGGTVVGGLAVTRVAPGRFSEDEIALLQTFADQAVIAIENARLFKELEQRNSALSESLEQQTATAEILSVISGSPTDIQPVFDAVLDRALTLCEASHGSLYQLEDGALRHVAARGTFVVGFAVGGVLPLESATGRAVLEKRTVHLEDNMKELDWQAPEVQAGVRGTGIRTVVAVPLLREQTAIGAITIRRLEVRPFSEKQIRLLQTFADQAVIAIENVRLFTELQASNRELTATLEQQTATSELLKVIGRSTFELQPVFETLAENTVRLCEAERSLIFRFDGQMLKAVATYNISPELRAFNALNPIAPGRGSCAGRVVLERRTVHIHDAHADPEYTFAARDVDPFRTLIGVPMLRAGELLGVIMIVRYEVRPFTDSQIALLETFADQAAIAIENARLLTELRERTTELTRSVGELKALGEVSHSLSSTLDVDVVLNTIVTRANDLIGADGCTIFEYDEAAEQFHLRATRNLEPRLVELARGTPLRRGDQGILGRLPSERQAVQVPDITIGSYSSPISDALIEAGYRAVVAVPLVREDHLIGALTMNRKTPGEFPPETIQLLQTFATQSALAIQNARLFREVADKSRQLEVASQHKSEFLANMSHELRTPLNAIIGFSEVLTDRMFGELNEKQDEYLKDIYSSGTHLLSLINDILDLSKIEAGRMELELTDFHLPTALDNALTLVRERAGRRSITLQMSVDERLGEVRADERKIRQVLLNLLSNAIKFTPEGGRIEVAAVPTDGFVEVSVSDTGVGIAPEDHEAVFEEFRQVGTADKKAEGTGLGLTLCRKFIELHGGRIWVKSQVGVGSTFTFTIPARCGE